MYYYSCFLVSLCRFSFKHILLISCFSSEQHMLMAVRSRQGEVCAQPGRSACKCAASIYVMICVCVCMYIYIYIYIHICIYVMLYYSISCCIISYYILLYDIISCHNISYYVIGHVIAYYDIIIYQTLTLHVVLY